MTQSNTLTLFPPYHSIAFLILCLICVAPALAVDEVIYECEQRIAELGRDAAIRNWEEPANAGNAKAQFCLGYTIRPPAAWIGTLNENQAKHDAQVAIEWFRRAAKQGLAPAQEALAHAYTRGSVIFDGVSQDLEKARYWMEKSANQGSPFANVFLGQWYRDGDGALPINKLKAYRHMRLAVGLLKAQSDPSAYRWDLGLEEEVERLAQELTDKELADANSWAESQLDIHARDNDGATDETVYGLELAPESMREKHLDHFMKLFHDFCLKQKSQKAATQRIVNSERFRTSKDFKGIYEEHFDGISYAVTPDPDWCTVDVLLEYQSGSLLMTLDEVQEEITRLPNYGHSHSLRKTEVGPNSESVETIESHYHKHGLSENEIVLTYPTSNQDVFYMTLNYHYK